jgi:hypothetical protein
LPHQAGALHEKAREDEQRDRHQRVAPDEAEELAEDDVVFEQRIDEDVGRARRGESDADRHAQHEQYEGYYPGDVHPLPFWISASLQRYFFWF